MRLISFFKGKSYMDWGIQCLTSSGALFPSCSGEELVLLEEAIWKQGMIAQEVRNFVIRLAGPVF